MSANYVFNDNRAVASKKVEIRAVSKGDSFYGQVLLVSHDRNFKLVCPCDNLIYSADDPCIRSVVKAVKFTGAQFCEFRVYFLNAFNQNLFYLYTEARSGFSRFLYLKRGKRVCRIIESNHTLYV